MNNLSIYIQTQWLNTLSGVVYTPATTYYLALFTVTPTQAAGSGTEVFAGDYERQAISFNAPAQSSTQGAMQITNANTIRFPAVQNAVNSWGTVTGAGIFDAISAGNMIAGGPLAAQSTIGVGGYLLFAPASVSLSLD